MTPSRSRSTATPAPASPPADAGLTGVAASLADVVCWLVFYLQRSSSEEIDLEVAETLLRMVADRLRAMPPAERVAFLEHATTLAETSAVGDYQDFLLDLAETMGLE